MRPVWLMFCIFGAAWGQASLSGIVVNSQTGEPVKRVAISLTGSSANDSPATLSDAAGRFFFADVPTGRYRLSAEKSPFLRWEHGQRKALGAGTSLELKSGEQREGVVIRLQPGAVVSGRITDEDNEPAVGAQITLERVFYVNGRRHFGAVGHANADDRGEYRLHSIPPGRFVLRANFDRFYLPNRVTQRYLPTYFPAADSLERATWPAVSPGADLRGTNVVLRPSTASRIQGLIVDAASGQPVRDASVTLISATGNGGIPGGFVRNEMGTFLFPAVAPGSYLLTATRNSGGQLLYGRLRVDVAQNVDNLRIRMEPGLGVEGVVRVEGDGAIDLTKSAVGFQSTETYLTGGNVALAADGTFAIGPVPAAPYLPHLANMGAAYLREVRIGGWPVEGQVLDLSGQAGTVPIEIVVSLNGGMVEGSVGSEVGAVVVLEPSPGQAFRNVHYRTARTDASGSFKLAGVAPGEYTIYAFDEIESGAWLDASYMAAFAGKGENIKISAREVRKVTLPWIDSGK